MGKSKPVQHKSKAGKILLAIFVILLIGALAASVTFNVLQYRKAQGAAPLDGGSTVVSNDETDDPSSAQLQDDAESDVEEDL